MLKLLMLSTMAASNFRQGAGTAQGEACFAYLGCSIERGCAPGGT
jgi:hypothetical protein